MTASDLELCSVQYYWRNDFCICPNSLIPEWPSAAIIQSDDKYLPYWIGLHYTSTPAHQRIDFCLWHNELYLFRAEGNHKQSLDWDGVSCKIQCVFKKRYTRSFLISSNDTKVMSIMRWSVDVKQYYRFHGTTINLFYFRYIRIYQLWYVCWSSRPREGSNIINMPWYHTVDTGFLQSI